MTTEYPEVTSPEGHAAASRIISTFDINKLTNINHILITARDYSFALQWHALCHLGGRPWDEHDEALEACEEHQEIHDRACKSLFN